MSGRHVFVDETKQAGYLVAATVVLPRDLDNARKEMRGLLLPRQRSVHFTKEDDGRRGKILATIAGLGLTVTVYDAAAIRDVRQARVECLRALVEDAAAMRAGMLVIEQDDSLVANDRKVLYDAVRKIGAELRYEHKAKHADPLLWVPDAVAWCWAKRGKWRGRVEGMVTDIRTL